MESTTATNNTTSTTTDTASRPPIDTVAVPDPAGTGRRRIWLGAVGAVGAAVAVAAIGIVSTNIDDEAGNRPLTLTLDQRQVAAELERTAVWAEANGLSGLSPASLRPHGEQVPNIASSDLPRTADAAARWLAP